MAVGAARTEQWLQGNRGDSRRRSGLVAGLRVGLRSAGLWASVAASVQWAGSVLAPP